MLQAKREPRLAGAVDYAAFAVGNALIQRKDPANVICRACAPSPAQRSPRQPGLAPGRPSGCHSVIQPTTPLRTKSLFRGIDGHAACAQSMCAQRVAVRRTRLSVPVPRRSSRFVSSPNTIASSTAACADAAGLPQADLVAAIPRLRRYARVLTGDSTRADDLVQDTLARAWEKRRLWKAGSDLRAWMFMIMHNVYVNQLALARREARNVSLDADGEDGVAWQVAVGANQLDRVELRELIHEVGELPVEQREVLLLAAVEELRYQEIAAALAIPVGTVMSRSPAPAAGCGRGSPSPPRRARRPVARGHRAVDAGVASACLSDAVSARCRCLSSISSASAWN